MKHKLFGIFAAILVFGGIIALTPTAFAKPNGLVINVNNHTLDQGDATPGNGICETANGNNVCTLRAAIQEANALSGAEIINLEVGQTYTLTRVGVDGTAVDGDLDILTPLTINGNHSTVNGNGNVTNDRVLEINNVATVIISELTVENGKGAGSGGGIINFGGTLALDNVTVQYNSSASNGGGLAALGKTNIINSTFANNTVTGTYSGGGIYMGADMLIQNSAIINNQAPVYGAGFYGSNYKAVIANTTIGGNRTDGSGGGIAATGSNISLDNVTITDNYADNDNNNVGDAGGLLNVNGAQYYLINTILANNYLENGMTDLLDDCAGIVTSYGYNLLRTTSGCSISANVGDKFAFDPKLSILGNYGGPTQTYSLQATSPAIDTGNPGGCNMSNAGMNTALTTDQRGYGRPANGGISNTCDMGAFEYNAAAPIATVTPTNTPKAPTAVPTNTPTTTPTLVQCQTKPLAPVLVSPANNAKVKKARATLDWEDTNCATNYTILVRQDSNNGLKVAKNGNLTQSTYLTPNLTVGHSYFWQVSACNVAGCTKSQWAQFNKP